MYVYTYIYIYIYIHINIYVSVYTYIYIYIERERERDLALVPETILLGAAETAPQFWRAAVYREFTKGGLVKGGLAIIV